MFFVTPHFIMDRSSKQKISKFRALNETLDQTYLIDI